MKTSIIVAMSSNNVIGYNGNMPWYIPNDLTRFKQLTTGHAVIMGRKTHESIGRVLPDRDNIVISRNPDYFAENCINSTGINDAIEICHENKIKHAFIIGGGEVYAQALQLDIVDTIYMTRIYHTYAGDAYFPDLHHSNWEQVSSDFIIVDTPPYIDYELIQYDRIK